MPQKKAFIDIQVNWIFIIIVGGLILIFFFMIVGKQKEVSETKISRTIRFDLSSIFTSAKITTGSATLIDIPNIDISYDCQGYGVGGLSQVKPQVAFSPSLLKGFQIMTWTLGWSMPFRVVNFQYITSPNVRYIFVDDDSANPSKADDIFEILPDEKITERGEEKTLFNKWIETDVNNIADLNNYKVRVIYFTDPNGNSVPNNLQAMENKDLTALYIDGGTDGVGTIHFYKKNGNSWAKDTGSESGTEITFYIGTPSLLGAIFSDNIDTYNCNMKQAYIALDKVAEIYLQRTEKLKDHYPDPSSCRTSLGNSAKTINDPTGSEPDIITNNKKHINIAAPGGSSNLKNIWRASLTLFTQNQNLQRLSCAEVY